ncbi:MAG: nucleoside phosphorylase [Erysipelotrichaceae bacterium]
MNSKYPILEFDKADGLISPVDIKKNDIELPNKLVITFFKEVVIKLLEEKKIEHFQTIDGENDIVLYKFIDSDILLWHGIIGCPACSGTLDELSAYGINKIMFCGGGGVLKPEISLGHFLIMEGAIRDEGFSYHYIEPSRIIEGQKDINQIIENYLTAKKIPFEKGLVWTTDAIFRETKEKIQNRKAEGAIIVEMEQAGNLAVAQFRNLKYGAIIYAGDNVSGEKWNYREWKSASEVRYNLVQICKELVEKI